MQGLARTSWIEYKNNRKKNLTFNKTKYRAFALHAQGPNCIVRYIVRCKTNNYKNLFLAGHGGTHQQYQHLWVEAGGLRV